MDLLPKRSRLKPFAERQIKVSTPTFNVLFVCTGNTCRSPMAEQIFNEQIKGHTAHALSAGLDAKPGSLIHPQAADALTALGYTSTGHSSRLVSTEAVENADVILSFTQDQKNQLVEKFPSSSQKCFTISEFANITRPEMSEDVVDPFGKSTEVYKQTAITINSLVKVIVSSLKTS